MSGKFYIKVFYRFWNVLTYFKFRLEKAAHIVGEAANVGSGILLGSSPVGLRSRRSHDAEE